MKSAYDYYSKITINKTKEMIPQVLDSLTYNKAFFTKKELEEKIVASLPTHMQQEGDARTAVLAFIIEEMKLVPLYPSQKEGPWSQFTTAAMIAKEREMVELAKKTSENHEIPGQPDAIRNLVEKAFASRPTMADEQKEVVKASCLTNHNVVIVEGTAGAGKSFSLNAIREVYESIPPRKIGEKVGYDIIGTALSWTATKVLEESAGLTGGMAIEGFVRRMKECEEKGLDFFNRRTVVIVDEAGLAPTTLMKDILHYASTSSHDVRVILTGDSLQLNPVQAGNALELLVAECGSTRLDTIRRQKQESHRQAVKHFCYGRAENGLYTHYQQESVHFAKNKDWVLHEVVKNYVKFTTEHPDKSALVLALKNVDVDKLNSLIREALKREGRVDSKGVFVETYDGRSKKTVEFAVGDQIVFRQNAPQMAVYETPYEKAQEAIDNRQINEGPLSFFKNLLSFGGKKAIARHGVFNRTIGTLIGIKSESDKSHTFTVLLAEGGEVKVNTKDYINKDEKAFPMTHNFATTIYASQGQTVSKVIMLDDPNMNRKLAYVGASRHTDEFDLYLNCEELNQRIIKKIERERAKASEKLKKDMASGKASFLAEVEESRLYAQYPKYDLDHQFTQKEYLGVVASSWNTHSLNQTVSMARKQQSMKKKRNPSWISPLSAWYALVEKAPEDVSDDYIKKSKPLKSIEVEKEVEVDKTFLGFSYGKKVEKVLVREDVPHSEMESNLVAPLRDETVDLTSVDEKQLLATEKELWIQNKNEEVRVLALTPNRQVVARYDLKGNSVIGDGEIPVFLNKSGTSQTPFLVVHSFREAVLAHQHYRTKHGEDSVKVPHVVWRAKDANLGSLLGWLPPNPSVYIAVSKAKDGLEIAQKTAEELSLLNITSDFLPKIKPKTSNNNAKP